jgi:hypothetical protein
LTADRPTIRRNGRTLKLRFWTLRIPERVAVRVHSRLTSYASRRPSDMNQIEVFDPRCVMLPDHLGIDMAEHFGNILRPGDSPPHGGCMPVLLLIIGRMRNILCRNAELVSC